MAKGGNFENEITVKLSLMWSNGEKKKMLRRKKLHEDADERASVYQGGDLAVLDPDIAPLIHLFNLEMKTGYCSKKVSKKKKKEEDNKEVIRIHNWAIMDVLDGRTSAPIFLQMWGQSIRDAEETARIPLLIFRRNQRTPCIAMESGTFDTFSDYFGEFESPTICLQDNRGLDVIVLAFEDFKKWAGTNLRGSVMDWADTRCVESFPNCPIKVKKHNPL